MIELKPCPKCKSGDINIDEATFGRRAYAMCRNCGHIGPDASAFDFATEYDMEQEARRLWNDEALLDAVEGK